MLSPRTVTTATDSAAMSGCCEALASRKPETASSATPQPVASAPAPAAISSRLRSGRATRSKLSSGLRAAPARVVAGPAGAAWSLALVMSPAG